MKKTITTKKAFEQLLKQRGLAAKLGKKKNYFTVLRINHKQGKVSEEKMCELLKEAGYKIAQERTWIEPKQKL